MLLNSGEEWIHVCEMELSPTTQHQLQKNCTATLIATPKLCSSSFSGWTWLVWLVTSVMLAAVSRYWKGCYWKPWDNRDERNNRNERGDRLLSQLRITAAWQSVPHGAGETGTYQKLCRCNWQQETKQINYVTGSLYRSNTEENIPGKQGCSAACFFSQPLMW